MRIPPAEPDPEGALPGLQAYLDETLPCLLCKGTYTRRDGHECQLDERIYRRRSDLRSAKVPERYIGKLTESVTSPVFPVTDRPWILLTGVPGTGKTHRACELLLARFIERKGRKNELFVDWPDFILRRKESIGTDSEDPIGRVRSCDSLIVIDDLGAERASDYAADSVNLVLGNRYNHELPTILTTNLTSREISSTYGERIASRILEVSLVIEKNGKNWRAA